MRRWSIIAGLTGILAVLVLAGFAAGHTTVSAASQPQLKRYPYLTDVVSAGSTFNATINWATDTSQTTGYATYGQAGVESVTAHKVNGSKTSISVNGVAEYQWKAKVTGLQPGTLYNYRVFFNSPVVDLLGVDPSPSFTTPPASGSYSFAVLGDWGSDTNTGDQANLMSQIANSGASFILSAGDVAYPSGNQANYGDLFQTGTNISDVFDPSLYKNVGDVMSMFGAPGNHGFNSTFLNVWPEPTAPVLSAGRYQMDSYSVPGTTTTNYPSAWYAFTVGNARFYVLTAAWANTNVGTGTLYSNDYAAHWAPSSAEYQWLANDLATHPAALKFAVFHFPMYSDNCERDHGQLPARAEQPRGAPHQVWRAVRLQRPRPHLRAQLPAAGRELRVLRHRGRRGEARAHRPARDQPVRRLRHRLELHVEQGLCDGGGQARRRRPAQVFSFLKVTVTSSQVTVTPINSLGQSFDVVTYGY